METCVWMKSYLTSPLSLLTSSLLQAREVLWATRSEHLGSDSGGLCSLLLMMNKCCGENRSILDLPVTGGFLTVSLEVSCQIILPIVYDSYFIHSLLFDGPTGDVPHSLNKALGA